MIRLKDEFIFKFIAMKYQKKDHNPRVVTLVCDTTFYGKEKGKLATVFFHDTIEDEILLWRYVDTEKSRYYKDMLEELFKFTILSEIF
ncbi:hypothetical protein CDV26_06070 [Francisella halioticida]|uniref:Transposase n=1 Tax=Francisella halioticida TaxID=549298 RepID=A0ABM6LZ71_9GAMM|nr:hypothetical protein [Francisella halioticida]ASG68005.1 hypothetical protein CDV26_06070 [Francisella halioticida]